MEAKGLSYFDIEKNQVLLDADNVFWGIINQNHYPDALIPRELISLYEKRKESCDRQMQDFRFSQELTAIYIDPTDRCNADCPYCYVPAKIRKDGRSMTEKELFFILEKIAEYFLGLPKKAVIIFHASEPLLVKEIIFKAIKRFRQNFYFGIQTNGLLLTEDDIGFIKDNQVGIGISLDGATAAVNNRSRCSATYGGNFKQAIRAIELFGGYAGLNVITTITRFNVQNLPALVRLLHKKKVPCVLINPLRFTQKKSLFLKPDERVMTKYFIQAVSEAIRLSKNSKRKIIIGNFTNIILGIIAPTARRLMCDISPCGGGRCFLTITANGDMIPCGEFIGLEGFGGGNIFKDSINKAMASGPFRKIRSRLVEKIDECAVCSFRNICGAPCPAELHALGNIHSKSVFCEFYKAIINYAFRLLAAGQEKYLLRKEGFAHLNYQYKLIQA